MKTQKRVVGDIVQIDFEPGWHTYARVLRDAMFAIYDARSQNDLSVEEVILKPILFRVAVMDFAVKKGRWKVVGNRALERALDDLPPRFIQDPIRRDHLEIYQDGKIRPSSLQECLGLDRASVWDPEHVEDRLQDHYAGRTNKWVELERIKIS